jgi:hypothetical protein
VVGVEFAKKSYRDALEIALSASDMLRHELVSLTRSCFAGNVQTGEEAPTMKGAAEDTRHHDMNSQKAKGPRNERQNALSSRPLTPSDRIM